MGDYIDRGPDSKGVADLVQEVAKNIEAAALRGNHEQMMLDSRAYFEGRARNLDEEQGLMWFSNGADQTLKPFPSSAHNRWYERIPPDHWAFFPSKSPFLTISRSHSPTNRTNHQ